MYSYVEKKVFPKKTHQPCQHPTTSAAFKNPISSFAKLQSNYNSAAFKQVIQRTVIPLGDKGEFKDLQYDIYKNHYTASDLYSFGAKFVLLFTPRESLGKPGDKISLIQTVKDTTYKETNSGQKLYQWNASANEGASLRGNRGLAKAGCPSEFIIDQILLSSAEESNPDKVYFSQGGQKLSRTPVKFQQGKKLVNLDPRYTESRMDLKSSRTQESQISRYIKMADAEMSGFEELKQAKIRCEDDSAAFARELTTTGITGPTYSAEKKTTGWTPARLSDEPTVTCTKDVNKIVGGGMEFEVVAMLEKAAGDTEYLGSVKWGWHFSAPAAPAEANIELYPFAVSTVGAISDDYRSAAQRWNQMDIKDTGVTPLLLPLT